jgi:hypothetical protein
MALIDAPERHEDLFEELIAEVATYNDEPDRELISRAFDFATRARADAGERVLPPRCRCASGGSRSPRSCCRWCWW